MYIIERKEYNLNSPDDHNNLHSAPEQEQYYRLVPAEESRAYEYGTVSFSDFIKHYWQRRRVFYWFTAVFLIFGILFALFSQEEYTAETTITSDYELQDQASEIIESYSTLFGLTGNIRKLRNPAYLLEQYPPLIASTAFQLNLMQQPFTYSGVDSAITLQEYFTKIHRPPLSRLFYSNTFDMFTPSGSASGSGRRFPPSFRSSNSDAQNDADTSAKPFPILELNPEIRQVKDELLSRIDATYEHSAGVVRIQTKMPEPELAAILAQLTLRVLHENLRVYKNEKSQMQLEYLQTQQTQAMDELEEARTALVSSGEGENRPFNERLELQSNYEANLNRLNAITEQINRIRADIRNQMPVFRVINDITVPNQKSEPDRVLIITLSLLLGIFLAFCWITAGFFFARLK